MARYAALQPEPPPKPFTSDGCSGLFMRLVHWHWYKTARSKLSDDVKKLCLEHDKEYWRGGTASQRIRADTELVHQMALLGQPFLARLMMLGVGIGGQPFLPFKWRWGYGWPYKESWWYARSEL